MSYKTVKEKMIQRLDGTPQKWGRGTGNPNDAGRCAIYSMPCFQFRSITGRSTFDKKRERHVEGQLRGPYVGENFSMQCSGAMFSDRRSHMSNTPKPLPLTNRHIGRGIVRYHTGSGGW